MCFTTRFDEYFNINSISDHLIIRYVLINNECGEIVNLMCWSNADYTGKWCYKSNLNNIVGQNYRVTSLV